MYNYVDPLFTDGMDLRQTVPCHQTLALKLAGRPVCFPLVPDLALQQDLVALLTDQNQKELIGEVIAPLRKFN